MESNTTNLSTADQILINNLHLVQRSQDIITEVVNK